jgi:hypothetical protein
MTGENEEAKGTEVSRGHEDAEDQQETDELEQEAREQEKEVGPNHAAYSRGRWEGSDVTQAEIY